MDTRPVYTPEGSTFLQRLNAEQAARRAQAIAVEQELRGTWITLRSGRRRPVLLPGEGLLPPAPVGQ